MSGTRDKIRYNKIKFNFTTSKIMTVLDVNYNWNSQGKNRLYLGERKQRMHLFTNKRSVESFYVSPVMWFPLICILHLRFQRKKNVRSYDSDNKSLYHLLNTDDDKSWYLLSPVHSALEIYFFFLIIREDYLYIRERSAHRREVTTVQVFTACYEDNSIM